MSLPGGLRIDAVARREPAAQRTIMRGLNRYNDGKIGNWPFYHFTLTVRGKSGRVQGGMVGMIYWGWLFISHFWLDQRLRGDGVGGRCMAAAEKEAMARGCHGIWLDTGSFQAPGFYRKLGFRQMGHVRGQPPGFERFWFYKRLRPKRPSAPKHAKRATPPARERSKKRA